MVQLFMALGMSELAAFLAFADVYPDDCLLLVDAINPRIYHVSLTQRLWGLKQQLIESVMQRSR